MNKLKNSGSRQAAAALKLLGDQDYLLATILIVNNLVNICAVIVSNSVIDGVVGFNSHIVEFVVKVIVVTFVLLLFGEIMPKVYAAYNAPGVTKLVSRPLLFLKKALHPFAYILIHTGNTVNRRVAVRKGNISMDELTNAIEITSDQTVEEKKILSGIVSYINTEVEDIMRPRIDIVALDYRTDFPAVCRIVMESGFSRIPVYREDLDDIAGILYVKDLLPYLDAGPDFDWQKLCRQPYFVPGHKKINDLFTEFQTSKIHIAIVVDEYGSTLGIVSLEDILEEIVGEISDESDVNRSDYTRIDPDTYIFEGKTHLLDFLKIVGLDEKTFDDVKGEAESVAGLMLEVRGDFLKEGDTLRIGPVRLTVESTEGRRISRVRVHIDRSALQHHHSPS